MDEMSRGIAVVKLMKQVMGALKQNMGHKFKEMNLTGPQGMLIGILSHNKEMKVSDLSEKLGLSNSTVSGILDRLENQGLIERVRSKEDRRVVFVSVTEEFKRTAQEHFTELESSFEAMTSTATPEEIDTIIKGLDMLKTIIERQKE